MSVLAPNRPAHPSSCPMQKLLARVVIRNSQRPGQPRAFPRSYYAPVTTSSYMATSVELPHIKRLSRGDYEV